MGINSLDIIFKGEKIMTHKEYTLGAIGEYLNTLPKNIRQIIEASDIEFETLGELQYYVGNLTE